MRVAIIGAGINGLYLAWQLAQRGHQVTVFEKRAEIGKEVCSGLFSGRIFEFIPQAKDLVCHKLNFCLIHFPRKTIRLGFKYPFFVIEHRLLDKLADDLARKAGVKIVFGTSIEALPGDFDLHYLIKNMGVDRVIGCDGALSIVRQSLNLPDPKFRLGIQGFVLREDKSEEFEVWPIGASFFWRIPRRSNVEYGLLGNFGDAKPDFEEFCRRKEIKPTAIKSALIPQGLIVSKDSKVTLCGDAAGLCKPWSGGGVIWGLTAADLLLKHFPDFFAYGKALKELFYPQILLAKTSTKVIYFLGFHCPLVLPKERTIDNDFLFW